MKKIISRLVVLFAVVALVFGTLPANSAEAASKKSKKKSIVVTTQEELVAALKSGKYTKITIKTDDKATFKLNAKYSTENLSIVIDAPNATISSKATFKKITVNDAKTVKEYASGNSIVINDDKLTFKAMPDADVAKLTVASEDGDIDVVNNGSISSVSVTGESNINLEQNGTVGKVYLAAAAEFAVTGTSEEKLSMTVKAEGAGATVKSEIPVKVNAYADVDLTLEKGAESSSVNLKNEDAGVKLENNTDKSVTVKDNEGETQKVKKGEDLTTDNFVGKTEETPETPEGGDGTVTEQPKDEEKKEEEKEEEKKEEEKKDDTASTGTGSTGDTDPQPYIPYVSPEDQLQNNLDSASQKQNPEDREAWLKQNISLTKDLEIPADVGLVLDGFTLNAGSNKIVLGPDARIVLFPGSKLILEKDSFVYSPDNNGFTHAEIQFGYDAELKIGDCSFVGTGSEIDPVNARIILENNPRQEKVVRNLGEGEVDLNFIERSVRFDFIGGSLSINSTSGSLTDVPKAFGTDTSRWASDPEIELKNVQEGGLYTTLEINPLSNVLYDKKTVTFNNTVVYEDTIGVEDWINAYLDYGMYWSAVSALEQGKTAPTGIERTQDANGNPIVTISADTIHFKKNVYVQGESTLIAKNVVYDAISEPTWKVLGGDFSNDPGIRVSGNLKIDSIKSTGFFGKNHELIRMEGAYGILTMGNRSYKIVTTDTRLTEENWAAYGYFCWNAADQNYGFLLYTWDAEFTLQASDGAEYFDVVKHPINGELVPEGTPIVAVDSDQLWVLANGTSQWGAREFWDGANDISNENLSEYDEYAKRWLDFLEATLESKESVDAQYGNKKPLTVTPAGEDRIVELCGMKVVVDNDTTLVLDADTSISISRGANLVVRSISCDRTQGAGLCLDYQDNKAARVDLSYGGKLTIGDIVFQCANHGGGDGNYTVSFDVIGDNPKIIRIQTGEDVIIKKTDGSVPDVTAINNLGFTIQFSDTDENKPYFPSIKLNGKYVFADMNGKLVEGNYTMSNETTDQYGDKHANFETDSIAGLKAIWRLSADYSAETHNPSTGKSGVIWANVNYTGADNVEFEHICMDLPATITFSNATNIHLANNAKLQASVRIVSGSAITVGSGCKLATTMGSDTIIAGRLEVQNGEQGNGTVVSQMGSNLVIATGGAFELNGTFECGGIKLYNDTIQPHAYEVGVWFVNKGGTVSGNGNIIVTIVNTTDVALTDEEKTNIRNYVLTAINNNANIDITINEVKDNPEQ